MLALYRSVAVITDLRGCDWLTSCTDKSGIACCTRLSIPRKDLVFLLTLLYQVLEEWENGWNWLKTHFISVKTAHLTTHRNWVTSHPSHVSENQNCHIVSTNLCGYIYPRVRRGRHRFSESEIRAKIKCDFDVIKFAVFFFLLFSGWGGWGEKWMMYSDKTDTSV